MNFNRMKAFRNNFLAAVFSFIIVIPVLGQYQEAVPFAETITKEDAYDLLSILASDALEGRETGKRGQKMAAAFIKYHFQEIGLKPVVPEGDGKSYYQPLDLYSSSPGNIYVKAGKNTYKNFKEVVYYGNQDTDGEVSMPVVFAGYASQEEVDAVDVKDKAVVITAKGLRDWRGPFDRLMGSGAKMVFVVNTPSDEDFSTYANQLKGWLGGGRLSLTKPEAGANPGVFFTAPSAAAAILGTNEKKMMKASEDIGSLKKLKESRVTFFMKQTLNTVPTENVMGYLEGTDLKDEVIVITAHYDHIGIINGEINNGADDDGSGTTAVMQIASAFAKARDEGIRPRRSILFLLVTGEEKGLLGSAYYADHPIFPLEQTVANLNIDMIGRIDPEHEENTNYVYLVGSDKLSSDLHKISEEMNERFTKMELDYTYNDENHPERIYYRSDHWNFAKNGIPVIFYFNGVHEDYHQPTDTIEKIHFEMLVHRAKLVYYTAWALAHRDKRIEVDSQ